MEAGGAPNARVNLPNRLDDPAVLRRRSGHPGEPLALHLA